MGVSRSRASCSSSCRFSATPGRPGRALRALRALRAEEAEGPAGPGGMRPGEYRLARSGAPRFDRTVAVKITVTIGSRTLPVDQVTDLRVATAFRAAGQDVGRRVDAILCPEHKRAATNVRVHFDQRGGADLQYDSCCPKLGEAIGR